jgi:hypothetical protein
MNDEQLSAWAKQHQLQADTPIALYGNETTTTRKSRRACRPQGLPISVPLAMR